MLDDKNTIINEFNNEEYKKMTSTEKLVYLNKLKELIEKERDKVLDEDTNKYIDIIKGEKK